MDFFEIKNPLRRIGQDKYIIGQQPLDPLVLIEGKKIETNEISVSLLNFDQGFFNNASGENIDIISGYIQSGYVNNLVLQTGTFLDLSGQNLEVTSGHTENSTIDNLVLQTGTFTDLSGENLDVISGNTQFSIIGDLTLQTGRSDTFYISGIDILKFLQDLSGNLEATGLHLHEHIDALSGNLEATGLHLHEHIDALSGNLEATELHLHEHIDALSGNLEATGLHLHEHIDASSGNLEVTGLSLLNQINELESTVSGIEISGVGGSGISSGFEEEMLRSRFLQKEAFELNELGEVTPTTHEFISDTMWILREDNNLELRANLWRYDTGPNAFTDDISF